MHRAAQGKRELCWLNCSSRRRAYTGAELRVSAAERMRNNEEFQGTVADVPGLFEKLVRIVDAPEGSL